MVGLLCREQDDCLWGCLGVECNKIVHLFNDVGIPPQGAMVIGCPVDGRDGTHSLAIVDTEKRGIKGAKIGNVICSIDDYTGLLNERQTKDCVDSDVGVSRNAESGGMTFTREVW